MLINVQGTMNKVIQKISQAGLAVMGGYELGKGISDGENTPIVLQLDPEIVRKNEVAPTADNRDLLIILVVLLIVLILFVLTLFVRKLSKKRNSATSTPTVSYTPQPTVSFK